MPIIKSASKKLRQDKKRKIQNNKLRNLLKKILKDFVKNPSSENIVKATKIIDKLSKKHIIHKNKAARMKSKLSKLMPKTAITETRKKKKHGKA